MTNMYIKLQKGRESAALEWMRTKEALQLSQK
jgi:hypothetical protein